MWPLLTDIVSHCIILFSDYQKHCHYCWSYSVWLVNDYFSFCCAISEKYSLKWLNDLSLCSCVAGYKCSLSVCVASDSLCLSAFSLLRDDGLAGWSWSDCSAYISVSSVISRMTDYSGFNAARGSFVASMKPFSSVFCLTQLTQCVQLYSMKRYSAGSAGVSSARNGRKLESVATLAWPVCNSAALTYNLGWLISSQRLHLCNGIRKPASVQKKKQPIQYLPADYLTGYGWYVSFCNGYWLRSSLEVTLFSAC
jgi:hypothetical protein